MANERNKLAMQMAELGLVMWRSWQGGIVRRLGVLWIDNGGLML
jgi:hypothetical protein